MLQVVEMQILCKWNGNFCSNSWSTSKGKFPFYPHMAFAFQPVDMEIFKITG